MWEALFRNLRWIGRASAPFRSFPCRVSVEPRSPRYALSTWDTAGHIRRRRLLIRDTKDTTTAAPRRAPVGRGAATEDDDGVERTKPCRAAIAGRIIAFSTRLILLLPPSDTCERMTVSPVVIHRRTSCRREYSSFHLVSTLRFDRRRVRGAKDR